jgi:hypothetical protein
MPSTFVDTCELYGVATTNYNTLYGFTPSIHINPGTLQGDILSPLLLTFFLEPFLRWLTVGSLGYSPDTPTMNANPNEPNVTYLDHGFADDLSLATDSPTNTSL